MSSDEAPRLRPILLVLAAMFAFSLMAVFTRGAQTNILGVAAWRAIFVAVVFALTTIAKDGGVAALRPDATTLRLGSWLGVALAVASATFVGGYALTTVANTIFLHNLAPLMVFPLAWWLFKERSGPGAVTGAGIALFGVAMLSGVSLFQVSHFASSRFLLGDFLSFISAIGYAAVLVLTRMTRREETPILGTLTVAWAIAAVLLTLVAVLAGGFVIPLESMLWVLGLAVLCTNVPFYLLNLGMKSVSAGMAAVLSLSEVLFATMLGIIVYGEHLAPIGWIGGALAGLGVLYAVTQRGDNEAADAPALTLPEAIRTPRLLRTGLGLLVLNLGAFASLSTDEAVAPMITLVGLALVARFGPGAASVLLDGRFSGALRWLGALLGLLVLGSSYRAAGTLAETSGLGLAIVLLGVVLLDRQLGSKEPQELRDEHPVFQVAIGAFAVALILGGLGHGLSGLLLEFANGLLGLCGLTAALAGFGGSGAGASPGMDNLESYASPWVSARRAALAVGAVWLAGAVHAVPTGHVGIIERFGSPVGQTDGAGLVLRLPPPLETLTEVHVSAERLLDVGTHTLLTGDPSMISLEGVVHYTVSDAKAFAYGVQEPELALLTLSRAALVEVVARSEQDALLTVGRAAVEAAVLGAIQSSVDAAGLGVVVSAVNLTDVTVPAPVLASFLDVISADEERQTRINLAEAYAADLIPKTRGEAVARIVGAQGDAVQVQAEAEAYDVWFRSIQKNGASNMRLTRERIAAEAVERELRPARLIAAPSNVRVWLDDEGHWPRDPNSMEGR